MGTDVQRPIADYLFLLSRVYVSSLMLSIVAPSIARNENMNVYDLVDPSVLNAIWLLLKYLQLVSTDAQR